MSRFIGINLDSVHTVHVDEKIYFNALNLCEVFEIKKIKSALAELFEEDKLFISFDGGESVLYVNESGLYTLIFESPNPRARNFYKWLRRDLIPTVIETGEYDMRNKPPF